MSFIQNNLGWIRFYISNNNYRWSIKTAAPYEKNTFGFGWEHTPCDATKKRLCHPTCLAALLILFIYWILWLEIDLTYGCMSCHVFFDATRSRCFQRQRDITTCSGRHSSSTTGWFSRALQTPAVLISAFLPHCSSQWCVCLRFSYKMKKTNLPKKEVNCTSFLFTLKSYAHSFLLLHWFIYVIICYSMI